MFDFKTQLKVGDKGEAYFLSCYGNTGYAKADGFKYDFLTNSGKSLELKTDTYSMKKTENFFMERYGNIDKKRTSVGGPWRAKQHKIDSFVYLFISDLTFFWFDPDKLCAYLDTIVKKCQIRYIKNNGWTALGYLVKRAQVQHLCFAQETFTKDGRLITKI